MTLTFTGTRIGLTPAQPEELATRLAKLSKDTVLYGDCVGADEQFHELVMRQHRMLRWEYPRIETYPVLGKLCANSKADKVHIREKHLPRNMEMVQQSDYVIGCPTSMFPTVRGGTWYTLRYAQGIKVKGLVIFPDGSTEDLDTINLNSTLIADRYDNRHQLKR